MKPRLPGDGLVDMDYRFGLGQCRSTALTAMWLTAAALVLAPANSTALNLPRAAEQYPGSAAQCRSYFSELDARARAAGVTDAQYTPVAGHPYLRTDRLMAGPLKPTLKSAFKPLASRVRPDAGASFRAWVDGLRQRDADAREMEVANLPPKALTAMAPWGPDKTALVRRAAACATVLSSADLSDAQRRRELVNAVSVPDEYVTWQRAAGLYPLAVPFFLAGVQDLHRELSRPFREPRRASSMTGHWVRYTPRSTGPRGSAPDFDTLRAFARRIAANAARLPAADEGLLESLFLHHAPVLEVDARSHDDRIGTPTWGSEPPAFVDVKKPVTYTQVTFAHFDGHVLPQLNYTVWFPRRPPSGPLDLLSGHLDGVTYRVTLDLDGHPLLRDTMHNCGCYHFFVPTSRVVLRRDDWPGEEPPFIPQFLDRNVEPGVGVRTLLRIASGTHYVQRVTVERPERAPSTRVSPYRIAAYGELRSLPRDDGTRRSLFGPDGIVAGTERAERFFFWPMGVPAPGEMRQAGHHAIAFVGRRHFDDPGLIERYFKRRLHPQ